MTEEEGRLLEMLSMLIEDYEKVHPLPENRASEDAGSSARRERPEADRPVDGPPQEPRLRNPQRQTKHQQVPKPRAWPSCSMCRLSYSCELPGSQPDFRRQQSLHPSRQFQGTERLHQIIVRAQRKASQDLALLLARCQE